MWVCDIEVTGIPNGTLSEALECVQLAAAFAGASLPAAGLYYARPNVKGTLPGWPDYHGRKRASGRESGSKLHALQSFAPL
jgi:hypothetical protein